MAVDLAQALNLGDVNLKKHNGVVDAGHPDFTGANDAERVDAAIQFASSGDIVFVPESHLPFDPGNMPNGFDDTVRMIAEGRPTDGYHVDAYGAAETSEAISTAATTRSFQEAVNASANRDFGPVRMAAKHYTIDRLWLIHDATNNSDFPSDASGQGRVPLIGAGSPWFAEINSGEFGRNTILETSSSDVALNADNSGASDSMDRVRWKGFALVGDNSAALAVCRNARTPSFEDLLFYQKGASGDGAHFIDCTAARYDRVDAFAQVSSNSGVGFKVFHRDNTGAGIARLSNMEVKRFGTGIELGGPLTSDAKFGSAVLTNVEVDEADNSGGGRGVGMLIGKGAAAHLDSCWFEENQVKGCWVRYGARAVFNNCDFGNYEADDADLWLGDSSASSQINKSGRAWVLSTSFTRINSVGIRHEASGEDLGPHIHRSVFAPDTNGVGVGIEVNSTAANLHGAVWLANSFNSNLASAVSPVPDNLPLRVKTGGEIVVGSHVIHNDVNRENLSGDKSLGADDPTYQSLDPGGANRTITLPAVEAGREFVIGNRADAAEDLAVNNNSGATLLTLGQDDVGRFVSDGTGWIALSAAGSVS